MVRNLHTVLVIEDNDLNREIMGEILSNSYNLLFADNGKAGMQLLREHVAEIDVVLLDLQMPVMDGFEVLKAVSADEQLRHVPVIVTTSNDGADVEERCLALHAADFLKKPYNPRIVLLRIENLIRLRDYSQALTEMEFDKQTGAYTFNAFMHYASATLKQNPDVSYSLAISDIIGFKALLTTYGNKAYDLLKKEVKRISDYLPGHVLVGTYSFDHMLFLWPTLPAEEGKEGVARYEGYLSELSKELNVTVKVAICEQMDASRSLQSHLDLVRAALSQLQGTYNQFCTLVGAEQIDQMQRQRRIVAEMENAIRTHQMQVYYQPKHDAKTGALVGAEALLRWIHPEMGFISPGEFIPIFEHNGFVTEADYFVWCETCRYLRQWQEKGLKVVPVSVNCSRQDFEIARLEEMAKAPLMENHIAPELLHLEVTESFFADLSKSAIQRLEHLREAGIRIELDDFGTGYSSLHSLAELPIDVVKFDMSFVRKLNDSREQTVMKGCVELVKRLQLDSVAEGVEEDWTRQLLSDMGIDAIQGYFYSKPLPASEFEEYLGKWQ